MIYSIENSRFRKVHIIKKVTVLNVSFWGKSGLKVLLNPKFHDSYFCCLRDPEIKFWVKEMGVEWWTIPQGLHCTAARSVCKCDKHHFAFSARQRQEVHHFPFFLTLGQSLGLELENIQHGCVGHCFLCISSSQGKTMTNPFEAYSSKVMQQLQSLLMCHCTNELY